MVLPDHVCPYGESAKAMHQEAGYQVDDRLLTSRDEVDAFKSKHGLATTPMIEISGEQILGSEELAIYLRQRVVRSGAFNW
jgi:glutaredoxin 3